MEISKLRHLQRYMTYFEMDYRKIERNPQQHQLYIKFEITMIQVFETLETSEIDTITSYSTNLIELNVNINFGNTFHH